MARSYGLPVEASGIGTDQFVPGIQAGYERALNGLLTTLSWPDILVGPGLLGGSMVLNLAQLLIDTEIFRQSRRAHQGIDVGEDTWLEDTIDRVGPGGHFLAERSTVERIRGEGWYISDLGVHEAFEAWEVEGRPRLLASARQQMEKILATHQPLPLDEEVERELETIQARAQARD
jgi:trimethylamine--corrinoid protein Co-methyltransferase